MLGWKNICSPTFRNTTPRVVRMWALYTVPSVAENPHSLTWPPRPQPPSLPTLHTRTCSTHGRTCAHSHTQAARWVKCQESHLMKRRLHTNAVCLCRERPFYSAGQCLCWLSFVCTFLSTKSNRRNGGKKEVRQACNHRHRHVQAYTSAPFISL